MPEPTQIVVVPYSVHFLSSPEGFALLCALPLALFATFVFNKLFPKAPAWVCLLIASAVCVATIYNVLQGF